MSAERWEFDLTHSSVQFHVRHLMVSKVHGRFGKWGGALDYDAEDPTRSRLDVWIDAASVDTRDDQRDGHLRSPDFFDAASYPKLEFRSTKIERKADDRFALHGDLTIRGVTKPVVLDVESAGQVKDPWGGLRAGFSAKTAINRKDFGLTWNKALEAGGVLVGEKVEIAIELEAVKKPASASVAA